MANRQRTNAEQAHAVHANAQHANERLACAWPRPLRIIGSIAIVAYLTVVLLGPLSNPIGSSDLMVPLARTVAPAHQALNLGHGYRFFNEPGPSHLVRYRITEKSGDVIEGHFPDRDEHWPRLMYHRWFMLSETIFAEHLLPDDPSAVQIQNELKAQALALRDGGRADLALNVDGERKRLAENHKRSKGRVKGLVEAVANEILKQHATGEASDADRVIELFVQERSIPFASDVVIGKSLDDPGFLSEAITIYPKLDLPKLDFPPHVSPLFPLEEIPAGGTQ